MGNDKVVILFIC